VRVSELTGWVDYDRDKLGGLTGDQRIEYFEKRVRLVLISPLRRILATEIVVREEPSSALLIFAVSLCCAIEAIGKYITGGGVTNRVRFEAFLHGYMSASFQDQMIAGTTNGAALWEHFRNGLAHGFAVRHGGFEGEPHGPYFQVKMIAGYECLEINPTLFLQDFIAGFESYLDQLRAAQPASPLRTQFDRVFQDVMVAGR
jgi:hypothetical protein